MVMVPLDFWTASFSAVALNASDADLLIVKSCPGMRLNELSTEEKFGDIVTLICTPSSCDFGLISILALPTVIKITITNIRSDETDKAMSPFLGKFLELKPRTPFLKNGCLGTCGLSMSAQILSVVPLPQTL